MDNQKPLTPNILSYIFKPKDNKINELEIGLLLLLLNKSLVNATKYIRSIAVMEYKRSNESTYELWVVLTLPLTDTILRVKIPLIDNDPLTPAIAVEDFRQQLTLFRKLNSKLGLVDDSNICLLIGYLLKVSKYKLQK